MKLHVYYLPYYDRFFGDAHSLTPDLEAFMRTLYGVQMMPDVRKPDVRKPDGVSLFENERGLTLRVITRHMANGEEKYGTFDVTDPDVLASVRLMLRPVA